MILEWAAIAPMAGEEVNPVMVAIPLVGAALILTFRIARRLQRNRDSKRAAAQRADPVANSSDLRL